MTYWWTNLLWVNNLYPRAMDDKCLPWTWFIPCYVQLTLILPIFLFLAHKFKENGACILSALPILVISFNLMYGYFNETGGTIINNDEYYSKWFMTPLF